MIKPINYYLLIIFAILIPIAYTPNIYLNKSLYTIYSNGITLLLGLLFALSFFQYSILKRRNVPNIIVKLLVAIVITAIEFLIFHTGKLNYNTQDLISLLAVTLGIYIGYTNDFNTNQIKIFIIVFCVFSVVLGYLSIGTYVGSFSVYAPDYLVDGKNQIGQLLSLCVVLSFYLIFLEEQKIIRVFILTLFALSFLFMVIIKCKTAILSSLFVIGFIFFKLSTTDTKKILFLVGFPLAGIICIFFYKTIINGFLEIVGLAGKTSMAEFTTGRSTRNEMAVDYILNNFFTGELIRYSNIPLIHNWILLRFTRYGIYVFPFIAFYFSLLFYVLNRIIKTKNWNISNVGWLIVIPAYISSMVEPGAPFSPNTIYIIHYILLGIALNYHHNLRRQLYNKL